MLKERIIVEPNMSTFQIKHDHKDSRFKTSDQVNTTSFVKNVIAMGTRAANRIDLLPQNTRLHMNHYGVDFYVTEYPPIERSIRIDIDFSKRWRDFVEYCKETKNEDAIKYYKGKKVTGFRTRTFKLVIPFTIFVSEVRKDSNPSCFIFFRNSPLKKLSDKIGKAPFYNINGDQRACFSVPERGEFHKLEKPEMVDELVAAFWNSHFNSDYSSNMRSYSRRMNVVNYFMWEYISQTDPLSIFKIKWIPMKENLLEFLTKRMNRYCRYRVGDSPPDFAKMKQALRM